MDRITRNKAILNFFNTHRDELIRYNDRHEHDSKYLRIICRTDPATSNYVIANHLRNREIVYIDLNNDYYTIIHKYYSPYLTCIYTSGLIFYMMPRHLRQKFYEINYYLTKSECLQYILNMTIMVNNIQKFKYNISHNGKLIYDGYRFIRPKKIIKKFLLKSPKIYYYSNYSEKGFYKLLRFKFVNNYSSKALKHIYKLKYQQRVYPSTANLLYFIL